MNGESTHLFSVIARKVAVLRELGYMRGDYVSAMVASIQGRTDQGSGHLAEGFLSIKGRVACELTTTADELIVTEALCSGLFHKLTMPEVAGLLSVFVSKGKAPKELKLTESLQSAHTALLDLAAQLARLQFEASVLTISADEYVQNTINSAMIEAVFSWAAGQTFEASCARTLMAEGDVVRVLSRVEELGKQVRQAARLLGDELLACTFDEVVNGIRRGVVAAPSLYFSD